MQWKRTITYSCWDFAKEHGIIYIIDGKNNMFFLRRKSIGKNIMVGQFDSLKDAQSGAEINFTQWLDDEQKDLG